MKIHLFDSIWLKSKPSKVYLESHWREQGFMFDVHSHCLFPSKLFSKKPQGLKIGQHSPELENCYLDQKGIVQNH